MIWGRARQPERAGGEPEAGGAAREREPEAGGVARTGRLGRKPQSRQAERGRRAERKHRGRQAEQGPAGSGQVDREAAFG
ncbi:hypothetical protein CLV68_3842 [Actinokineospora cianjurensis]|uniref:Uncharacterized protein n=1 Tax=Actinokineospora cianjurensis TaxID=585224 RepID=A0A421B4W2_9PSEU|nr:hypothetical protein CLV68_3842 [Actinokineospora cianjurensis]